MNNKETVSYCLDALKKAGADKAACSLNMTEKKELNVEIGEMTLLRTTFGNISHQGSEKRLNLN